MDDVGKLGSVFSVVNGSLLATHRPTDDIAFETMLSISNSSCGDEPRMQHTYVCWCIDVTISRHSSHSQFPRYVTVKVLVHVASATNQHMINGRTDQRYATHIGPNTLTAKPAHK